MNRIIIANKNKEPSEDEILQSEIIVNSRNIAEDENEEKIESENKYIKKIKSKINK